MGRPNKCRKKVTLKKKNKGNILNLRIGNVLRRTLLQQNSTETNNATTEQNEVTTPIDQNLSESVPSTNCEIYGLVQELLDAISKKDDTS